MIFSKHSQNPSTSDKNSRGANEAMDSRLKELFLGYETRHSKAKKQNSGITQTRIMFLNKYKVKQQHRLEVIETMDKFKQKCLQLALHFYKRDFKREVRSNPVHMKMLKINKRADRLRKSINMLPNISYASDSFGPSDKRLKSIKYDQNDVAQGKLVIGLLKPSRNKDEGMAVLLTFR